MHRSTLVLAGLLFASPAFAQGDADAPADPVVTGEFGAEVGGTGAGTTTAVTGVWSRVLIDRPYVVPAGKIGAYGEYGVANRIFPGPPGMPPSVVTLDAIGVGAGYGVTDTITAGAQYGLPTGIVGDNEFGIIEGSLAMFGNFQLVHDGKMSITAAADFTFDLCRSQDAMGDCVQDKRIHAGLGARYNLSAEMAIYTGAPVGPGTVGQHLTISLETDGPITFDLPIGFMYQATPELNVQVSTNLAQISISNSESRFIFGDVLPLGFGGLFSVNTNIDVVGSFAIGDLIEDQFDSYTLSLGARYYTN